mgnify:CR=1 FL=1
MPEEPPHFSRTAEKLIAEGYDGLLEQRAGWDGARDPFVEARGEHRPFAAVAVARHADAFRVHLRQVRQRVPAVRADVAEER